MLVTIRSALFVLGYAITTFIYGTLALLLIVSPARFRHRVLISWCVLVIWWLRISCGVRYQIIGLQNLEKTSHPVVILSKHQSTWETLKLQSVFWPASTILKKELLSIPFFGWGLRGLEPIAIDRSNPRAALKQVKQEGIERLQQGMNLLLFPEGTRMAPGDRGKYARSGPEIAIAAGANVIPVAVNAGRCWPANTVRKYPGLVTVSVGEPILTAGKTSREIVEQVEFWIENELERIEHQATLVQEA